MRVCLVLEGSYPYSYGGVSSWTHQLINGLPDVEFVLLTVGPYKKKKGKFVYDLPKNVVEVHERFLDEELYLQPKRSFRFNFDALEEREIREMLQCGNPDWDVVIDAFRKQKCPPVSFLMSQEVMDMFSFIMENYFPRAPFANTFYMERSMMVPVLTLLGSDIPEADVYHAICTGYAGILAVVAGHVTNKPVCLTEHGIYSREREEELIRTDWTTADYKEQWIKFYYMLSGAIYKRSSIVTALFEGASHTQMEIGAAPEKCRVIPNGIDYDKFAQAAPKVPDGHIDIGAAVRFSKIKDIKTMIYSFYEAHETLPNLRLHILGPDEDKEYAKECRALIKDLGISDCVLAPGRVSDMVGYYGKLDFTILTSLSEGQPLCTLESFAAGRPAVTTDVGCCRELIEGTSGDPFGRAGYVARPMDPHAVAQRIIRLASKPDDIKKFGENGRRRVSEYFRRPTMIENYMKMYTEAVDGWNRI